MKNIILKITGYGLVLGLLLFGVRAWDIKEKWDVNSSPMELKSSSLNSGVEPNSYVRIQGGRLDITNAYEESLTTKKAKAKLSSFFYIPVVNSDGVASYILKRSLEPTISDMVNEVDMTGLLEDGASLSSDMLSEFNKKYKFGGKVFVLNSTYKAKTHVERAKGLLFPLYVIIGALAIRLLLNRNRKIVESEKISTSEEEKA